jgi:penicillin-binding protein 2
MKDAANVGDKRVELAESTVEQVTQGMYGVINEAGGTGNSVKLQGIEFCGKSGTAQMMSYSAASRLGLGKGKNDGWFVGFAPRRNPEIVVAAVVEDTAEHGGTASGPVVRDIVKAYYDKKEKKSQGQSMAQVQKPGVTPALVTAQAAQAPKVVLKRDAPAKVAEVAEKKQNPE